MVIMIKEQCLKTLPQNINYNNFKMNFMLNENVKNKNLLRHEVSIEKFFITWMLEFNNANFINIYTKLRHVKRTIFNVIFQPSWNMS